VHKDFFIAFSLWSSGSTTPAAHRGSPPSRPNNMLEAAAKPCGALRVSLNAPVPAQSKDLADMRQKVSAAETGDANVCIDHSRRPDGQEQA
jgi:hypothetical protein